MLWRMDEGLIQFCSYPDDFLVGVTCPAETRGSRGSGAFLITSQVARDYKGLFLVWFGNPTRFFPFPACF